jgi:hypothetical protein
MPASSPFSLRKALRYNWARPEKSVGNSVVPEVSYIGLEIAHTSAGPDPHNTLST